MDKSFADKNIMKSLIVKPIPTPSGADHPGPPSDVLPRHEFSMGFIGLSLLT